MKTQETIIVLLKIIGSLLFKLILFPLRIIVWIFKIIESVFRILKETLTFFIKQTESEVLK